jgi:hypothetical protein
MNGTQYVSSTLLNQASTVWQVVGAADFHGNGHTDLLWQHPLTGDLMIWEMNGSNYVSSTTIPTSTLWKVAAVGDFNGDGKPDIVWQYPGTNAVLLWLMNNTQYVSSTILNPGGTLWRVKGPR